MSGAQVTVVGSGNAFNTDGRAHASYLIDSAPDADGRRTRVLMDCGATTLQRLQSLRIDPSSIDAVALTHFHGDHYAGLPFVLLQMGLVNRRAAPLVIFGPPGVADACEAIYGLCYPGLKLPFTIEYSEIDARNSADERDAGSFDFRGLRLTGYPIRHRRESTGYRVVDLTGGGSFAFSGDTFFDEQLVQLVDGVDLALIELSMPEQYDPPVAHVALSEVRARGHELRAKRVVYTHITDDLARRVVDEQLGEAASDGAVYSF